MMVEMLEASCMTQHFHSLPDMRINDPARLYRVMEVSPAQDDLAQKQFAQPPQNNCLGFYSKPFYRRESMETVFDSKPLR